MSGTIALLIYLINEYFLSIYLDFSPLFHSQLIWVGIFFFFNWVWCSHIHHTGSNCLLCNLFSYIQTWTRDLLKSVMPFKIITILLKVAQTFSLLEVVRCKMKSGCVVLQWIRVELESVPLSSKYQWNALRHYREMCGKQEGLFCRLISQLNFCH